MLVVMSHIFGKSFDYGGECGVSFFFMLSGFILSYAYGRQVEAGAFKHKRFLGKQLSKFYPLHVLTFFVMVLLDARLGRVFEWEKLVANLLLLQSWVPSDDFYFVANGLSWFLSDLLFFYLMFPLVFRLLSQAAWKRLLTGCVIVLSLYVVLAVSIPETMINPLLYASPVTRLLDFAVGILVYRLFVSEAGMRFRTWFRQQPTYVVTWVEVVLVLAVVASFFVYEVSSLRFRCAALFWFVLPVVLYVFVVTDNLSGWVTRVLHHPLMLWLGTISFEIYLTHWVTMRVLYGLMTPLGMDESARFLPQMLLLTIVVIIAVSYLTKRYYVDRIYSILINRIK